MKDTDHLMRHPRGHFSDRASAQGTSCAWHDDQFGRGQNTMLGWSDPTFCHWLVAKRPLEVAPAQSIGRAVKTFRWTDRGSSDPVFSHRAGRTSSFLLVFLSNRGRGEELFTPLLHRGLQQSLHGGRGAMVRQINPMHAPKRTELHADWNDGRAGATPPFDARCVTGSVGSLPPLSRAARDTSWPRACTGASSFECRQERTAQAERRKVSWPSGNRQENRSRSALGPK